MLLAHDDEGPGPVMVLLHGFPLNRTIWKYQLAEIGTVYRVLAPDLRGFGETAAPDGVYAIDAMADDVMEWLDAMQVREPVILGGLSMGGYIALSAVLRYPERFRGLMLFDTRAAADSPDAARSREALAQQVESSGSVEAVVQAMLPRLFSPTTRTQSAHLIEYVHDLMMKTTPRAVAGALRGMAERPDRTADLARLTLPTLVLVGEDDAITPPEEARTMAEAIPRSRYVVVPGAGHLAPLEKAAECNAAIRQFAGTLP